MKSFRQIAQGEGKTDKQRERNMFHVGNPADVFGLAQCFYVKSNAKSTVCYIQFPADKWWLNLKSSRGYLCVPLRLCGELKCKSHQPQRRRVAEDAEDAKDAELRLRHHRPILTLLTSSRPCYAMALPYSPPR